MKKFNNIFEMVKVVTPVMAKEKEPDTKKVRKITNSLEDTDGMRGSIGKKLIEEAKKRGGLTQEELLLLATNNIDSKKFPGIIDELIPLGASQETIDCLVEVCFKEGEFSSAIEVAKKGASQETLKKLLNNLIKIGEPEDAEKVANSLSKNLTSEEEKTALKKANDSINNQKRVKAMVNEFNAWLGGQIRKK